MGKVIGLAKAVARPLVQHGRQQVQTSSRALTRQFRALTHPLRVLPDFVIIGAQKCGTSSLYSYVTQHPWVAPCSEKEVHFFDMNVHFCLGLEWYRAHFISSMYKSYVKRAHGYELITGEATPYYLFYPHAPERIFQVLPKAKLIALLRNPVDRAYSHYHHQFQRGRETLSFEDAIAAEPERLSGEREKILADESYDSFNHAHYSYLGRGLYVEQLQAWEKWFPREQMLVLESEKFFADPAIGMKRVWQFLQLSDWSPGGYKKFNVGSYQNMNNATRRRLLEYFALHNQRLFEYLGVTFAWDR